ncbi:MAG: DUF2087 domain-containing protein [Pseudodesulfovibrio sp.]|uniref:DUF2087 domain-containing protein n=1 Tax=Pseudodesulfovibrio indicus TaxID=1716143 RepID=A0A126QRR7_9BACT|nr:DUF2087 domain-containing protein [Pseudodesulfovibrio indicus]AMK12760.1 hypothetical protein AWY79_17435 [Pseudodesulfovibrio indicus]TDT86754.1 hypothetical protein EDC59_11172 [Pseudodesulfovibrio indicus]
MSRTPMPFYAGDVSALAKNLRLKLQEADGAPGHVELLNMLVKAGGYRNFQHFKAQFEAGQAAVPPEVRGPEVDFKRVKKVVRLFDDQGYLTRWPKKYSERVLCLWVMWSRIEPRTFYNECEISALLEQQHLFEDHALLRRELADHRMVERTSDGSRYRRLETAPPPEAVEVFRRLR